MTVLGNIRVGVAGWSYPDWEGYVYTPDVRDHLHFLAGYLDLIEINSTFYRPPDARNSASWAKRTQDYPDFYFTAKLHQDVTHEGKIEDGTVRAFHEGFEPLREAGKLKHLLAQFRWDFADSPAARDRLKAVSDRFGDVAGLVFELRHVSWQEPEALSFLSGLGATVANLDYPLAKNSFSLQECRVGTDGYLRLHGRNAAAWFDKKAGRDQVYNYLYSAQEIRGLHERALALARTYRALTIVANNHYEGKEVVNALQIKSLLTGSKVKVPPALIRRYPELKPIASNPPAAEQGSLF